MQLSVFLVALGFAVVTHALKRQNAAKLENTQNATSVQDTKNATMLEDEETAKGLNYLGVGYNLLKGNPDGGATSQDGSDPGLLPTRRIFELTWNQNKMSDDKRYKVPDQARYYEHSSCVETTTSQMFTGGRSYQQNLLSDVKGEGK